MTSTGWNVGPSPDGKSGIQQVDQSSQGQGDSTSLGEGCKGTELEWCQWQQKGISSWERTFQKNHQYMTTVWMYGSRGLKMTRKFPFSHLEKWRCQLIGRRKLGEIIGLGREGRTVVWFCARGVGSTQQEVGKSELQLVGEAVSAKRHLGVIHREVIVEAVGGRGWDSQGVASAIQNHQHCWL